MNGISTRWLRAFAFVSIGLILIHASTLAAQERGLSLAQLENLVTIHAPDELIAKQLQTRGIGFVVTSAIVKKLERMGAGPRSIAKLKAEIKTGELLIHAPSGTLLSLDGKPVGSANAQGELALSDLAPGNHTVTGELRGYKNVKNEVTIASRQTRQLELAMQWLGGFLSIQTTPADATVEVSGPQQFHGQLSDAMCEPGTYTIRVSHDGMTSATEQVTVAAEQHVRKQVHLRIDPSVLGRMVKEASASYENRDYVAALKRSRDLLALDAENGPGNAIAAQAYFNLGDKNGFGTYAFKAVRGGGTVQVPLQHLHVGLTKKLHAVVMQVSNNGVVITGTPPIAGCKVDDGLYPFASLTLIRAQQDNYGSILLHISGTSEKPGRAKNLDFAVAEAQIISQGYIQRVSSPSNAGQMLLSIEDLLTKLRSVPAPLSKDPTANSTSQMSTPADFGAFYFVDSAGQLGRLEAAKQDLITDNGVDPSVFFLSGEKSPVRVNGGALTFAIKLNPQDDTRLIRCHRWEPQYRRGQVRDVGYRETYITKYAQRSNEGRITDKSEVPLGISKLVETTYLVKPADPLQPGEYCLGYADSKRVYCIGVD